MTTDPLAPWMEKARALVVTPMDGCNGEARAREATVVNVARALAAAHASRDGEVADAEAKERREGYHAAVLCNGSTPYPLLDVLRILADAADHLRIAHNCDTDGWEVTQEAASAAREIIHEMSMKIHLTQRPDGAEDVSDG